MKKSLLRRVTSLALCAALTLSLAGNAWAFQDVSDESAYAKSIAVLEDKGYVAGTGNGNFSPNEPITVAQLLTILGQIAGDAVDQTLVPEGVKADGWSGGWVAWGRTLGLVDEGAGQYDRLTQDGVNAILANFCAMMGVEAVSVDSAVRATVTRGEASLALAQLAQADFRRLTGVTYTTVTEGFDWGPAVTKVVLDLGVKVDPKSVSAEKFTVTSLRTFPGMDYIEWMLTAPEVNAEVRPITNAYVSDAQGVQTKSGTHVTLELAAAPYLEGGSPFWFNLVTNQNDYVMEMSHLVATTAPLKGVDGKSYSVAMTAPAGYDAEGSATLLADDFDTTGAYTYVYDDNQREIDLTYASWFPKDNAAKGSTPLIIWLHGMGEGGTDPNVAILGNKVVNLITDDVQKNFGKTGAAVLAPQAPTMWLDTSGTFNMAMGTDNSESYYTEALMSLIVDFVADHPEIDPTRLYIGGCSNGGYMTINMLLNYPGAFAAAWPVCEPYANDWIDDEELAILADTPIWLTAAKSDTIVTLYEGYWDEEPPYLYHVTTNENGEEVPVYEYSNALFDRLTKAGAENVHFTLWDKVLDTTGNYVDENGQPWEYDGHWSWIYALNDQCQENGVSLFQWMAGQKGEGKLPQLPLEKTVYDDPINFYLVRHGETEFNVQGIMQGWSDSPLTANGIALSKQLGEGLSDVDFAAAYSSDSGRAVDTAKNVLAGRNVTLTTDENLREMYFGVVDGKSSEGVYTEDNIGYRFGVGFDDLGGETWEGLGARMHTALENAAYAHREEGGDILISTHGMSILATLYTLVPDAEGVWEQGEIDNCSVTILEWDNGVYTLKALNDTSYLN